MSSASEARALPWQVWALSFGGLGLAPVASGTFGTLGGIAIAAPLAYWSALPWWASLLLATTVVTLVGIPLGTWSERHYGRKDPGAFVLDEVAGYLVTVAVFHAFCGEPLSFNGHCAAFLLFRAADIVKPWPVRSFEALGGGLGIMVDDLGAGVYSGLALAFLGSQGFTWL